MLLQLAVGPMCLMVFQISAAEGLFSGLLLVTAITLIDGLYIALSGLGIATIINKKRIKLIIKIFGGAVLIFFGISTIAGALGSNLLPSLGQISMKEEGNIFLRGLLLTASNPLTILFWSGVFSGQVIQNKMNKPQLFLFGLGCVLSTLSFLSVIAFLGNIISGFLPQSIIIGMNIAVGILLIFFGIKLFLKNDKN
jgi:threonine/homoserine/homoserine lactone efflux protein